MREIFCEQCGAQLFTAEDVGFSGSREEPGPTMYSDPVLATYYICRDCADEMEATAMRDVAREMELYA